MKLKLFLISILILLFLVVPRYILGFSIWHLGDAINVAANMGAKLACSGKFISQLSPHQIKQDLLSYSPANSLVTFDYNTQEQSVTTDLYGLSTATAKLHPALGCILQMEDASPLPPIEVNRKPANTALWPQGGTVNTIPEKQAALDALLSQDNEADLQTRALVWIENGELIAESYASGFDSNSMLLGWSMGKSLSAIMFARMEQLGLADRNQKALFPEWETDKRREITLESLLRMSSGLKFDETYAPGSDSTKMLFLAPSASDVALTASAEHEPNTYFSYSSGTTNILNRWMHEQLGATPRSSYQFLNDEIFDKLNMRHSILETDPSGVFVGSSYIYASARDWARLGQLMLDEGRVGNEQLIPKSWVKAASRPNHSQNYAAYGYQFWLNQNAEGLEYPDLPKDAYFMLGNRKQAVMIAPSQNTIIVRLGWTSGSYPMNDNFSKLLQR
ncbi:serine hydrolase domain-containing protein [Alteromonas sp. a30]|uniref:serine hydrolase domain-containing protein n=1 Tax=Alteromonas sp. a30 TaxID=2730917 RepID=UPI00227F1503|nr:serine hydrolase [Alteromonas sp. a30]